MKYAMTETETIEEYLTRIASYEIGRKTFEEIRYPYISTLKQLWKKQHENCDYQ